MKIIFALAGNEILQMGWDTAVFRFISCGIKELDSTIVAKLPKMYLQMKHNAV